MALALLAGFASVGGPVAAAADDAERGRYLIHAGGCITCHTADTTNAIPLTGGRAIATPFGTFISPNLTPDRQTGIGGWTDADFARALRAGISPAGRHYYAAFPYTAYAGLTDGDVRAVAAYLRSIRPVHNPRREHDLPWYLSSRLVMIAWNLLNFDPLPARSGAHGNPAWHRGAYLVRHLGHCGECHTPRNWLGGLRRRAELAGNPAGPDGEKVPNLTPHRTQGIGKWSVEDIETFLESGMLPDGDFAGSSMSDVIDDSTGQLTAGDRHAIAIYLKSLPPLPTGGS